MPSRNCEKTSTHSRVASMEHQPRNPAGNGRVAFVISVPDLHEKINSFILSFFDLLSCVSNCNPLICADLLW